MRTWSAREDSPAGHFLDEEITAATVPAVSHGGLPRLPSGLLYARGLPYSYAAWIAGLGFGQTLTTYRTVSFVFALVAIAALFYAGAIVAGPVAGASTALIAVSFDAYSAAATFARPYTFFLAVFR